MFINIVGYENLYMIDENGSIKSLSRIRTDKHGNKFRIKEKILKPQIRNNYLFVRLSKDNIKKTFSVHRLVATHFIPNPQNKPYVNHIDGNRHNNKVSNLEWVTSNENMQHSYYVLNKNKRTVKCVDTGIIYKSMKEAERKTGILTGGITHSCRNHTRAGGYLWEYVD
jgi:hypothetical protein